MKFYLHYLCHILRTILRRIKKEKNIVSILNSNSINELWKTVGFSYVLTFWIVDDDNVEEYGEFFEGDMLLSDEQTDQLFYNARNGRRNRKYRWPNNTVPFQLSLDHSREQRKYIKNALKMIESVSCIRFVRHTNEVDYIEVQVNFDYCKYFFKNNFWSVTFDFKANNRGCFSSVGRQGGKQILNLQKSTLNKKCFRIGTIMHEFLHGEFI